MNQRVALDTNVLVSAFIASGPPSRLIEEAVNGNLELVLLEPTLIELGIVLAEKFGFEEERLRVVFTRLHDVASDLQGSASTSFDAVTGDPDDDLVLACAVEAGVRVLVTGDRRHLLPLVEHRGVKVLTPQTFLSELRAS